MKKAAIVIGVVLAVVALVAIGLLIAGGLWARAHGGYAFPMMGWHGYPRGVSLGGGGLLMLVLFGVMAGAVALLVVGLASPKQTASGGEPTALDILKRRYASGEIDREEFERMREEILE